MALERPARQAYVADACGDDRPLRATVESLLAAHDEAGSFGDRPVVPASERGRRLTPGTRLGPFRVESLLGAGGMGEVYRAFDTRLHRPVAVKVLPAAVADDADRRRRLEGEAVALAALNHPNVAAIYGLEQHAESLALVLELVEGPTLAERLAAGPPALAEIVWTARQIAEALEAAHDRGIIHRDLKPANIKISPDGLVKVLDFGLAKAVGAAAAGATAAATADARDTALGVVVGTAAYMSPEQARGLPVDRRTDIWAFGCVLFEMGSGEPPFAGATVTDTLAAVLEREPDWRRLRPDVPASIRRLLRRCLTKDPRLRLRDIGEARIALTPGQDEEPAVAAERRPRRATAIAAIATTLAAAALVAGAVYLRPAPAAAPAPVRFLVPPPEGGAFVRHPARTFFDLSPDGSQLAFVAGTDRARVWRRAMADLRPEPVPNTEGATSVFWSPDGRSLAFFADGKLKRVDLPGGAAVTLGDVPFEGIAHGTWGAAGVILLASSQGNAIFRVPAGGGAPTEVVTPDRAAGDVRVHWPWFLPDGRRFLYTARTADGDGELRLATLDGPTRRLMPVASNAQWIEPDVVVFVREGVLMGQRVDLDSAQTRGEPFAIADRVEYMITSSRAMFSASRAGTIAYHEQADLSQPVWVDQAGNELERIGSPAEYESQSVHLSADGTVMLVARIAPGLGTSDIWRLDLARRTEERLTDDRGVEVTPILSPDGRAIIFAADRRGSVPSLFRKDLVTGVEEPLLPSGVQQLVMDVIPRDNALLYVQRSKQGTFDLFRLPLAGGGSPAPVLESRHDKQGARVSPDGRAIAFGGFDQGRSDLFVAPWPIVSAPILAASNIVGWPRWSADSRRLFYQDGERRMVSLAVQTAPRLTVASPQPLFQWPRPALLFDVAKDGRLLLLERQVRAAERPVIVAIGAVGDDRP